MILIIDTDNIKVLNAIQNIVLKNTSTIIDEKYIYFICLQDFMECLYMVALHMQNSGASIDTTDVKEKNIYKITTGFYNRKRRYTRTLLIDETKFTY